MRHYEGSHNGDHDYCDRLFVGHQEGGELAGRLLFCHLVLPPKPGYGTATVMVRSTSPFSTDSDVTSTDAPDDSNRRCQAATGANVALFTEASTVISTPVPMLDALLEPGPELTGGVATTEVRLAPGGAVLSSRDRAVA